MPFSQVFLVWFSIGYLYDKMDRKARAWNMSIRQCILRRYARQLLLEQARERQMLRRMLEDESRILPDILPIILNFASYEDIDNE